MSKFRVKSRSDVYHYAIHNLPTFRPIRTIRTIRTISFYNGSPSCDVLCYGIVKSKSGLRLGIRMACKRLRARLVVRGVSNLDNHKTRVAASNRNNEQLGTM